MLTDHHNPKTRHKLKYLYLFTKVYHTLENHDPKSKPIANLWSQNINVYLLLTFHLKSTANANLWSQTFTLS